MPLAARRSAKGSFEPVGCRPRREHSGDTVRLIGNRQHGPLDGTRNAVVHRLRLVLIVDGIADGFGGGSRQNRVELLHLGVQATDDSLQLGELFHQLGGEVGLGQQRRFEDNARPYWLARIANRLGDQAAQLLHPHRLVEVAAEIFLEGHGLQHLHALAQRNLLVGLPEEARVVEAGAQYALIAMANQSIRIAVGVENRQKVRQQFAAGIFEREILSDGRASP